MADQDPDIITKLLSSIGDGTSAAAKAAGEAAQKLASLATSAGTSSRTLADIAATAAMNVVGPMVLMGKRLSSLTQSMYGAEGAFGSTAQTLTEFTERIQKTFDIFARMSPTPVAGAIRLAADTLAFATNTLNFQIQAAQKVADTFFSLAKVGATYSGRISRLARDSAEAGVSLKDYAKMVNTNLESISKFGMGVEKGALYLSGLTSDIYYSRTAQEEFNQEISNVNSGLLMMYGSFEELSKGVSDYLVLQAQVGKNLRDINVKELMRNGMLGEYLLRQKELTALTGKNADTLRKEEEERRRSLDYALKASRLDVAAQANLREGMGMIEQFFGPSATKYATEFFASAGKPTTESARIFEAANADAATAIAKMIGEIGMAPGEFRKSYMSYIESQRPVFEANAQSLEDLASINRTVNSNLISSMTEVSSAFLAARTLVQGGLGLAQELEQQRINLRAGLDSGSKAYVEAERERQSNQVRIDAMVVRNMDQMDSIIQKLNALQQTYIDVQDRAFKTLMDAFNKIESPLENLGKMIEQMVRVGMGRILGDTGTPPPIPSGATPPGPVNPPERAVGGVTAGPTVAGEAGPEAVIPLAGGSIPLRIDFDPIASLLSQQVVLTNELIGAVKDSVDVQERILNASY